MENNKKRINCTAENCIYNDCDCGCNASRIIVGTEKATCCDQTKCGTFKDKNTK